MHTCELTESHLVLLHVGQRGEWELPDNVALAAATKHMLAWCAAHGLEPMNTEVRKRQDSSGAVFMGLSFDVIVGKGDIAADQAAPGTLDNWTWSGRVDYWRYFFGRWTGGRQGRVLAAREDGLASVTALDRLRRRHE